MTTLTDLTVADLWREVKDPETLWGDVLIAFATARPYHALDPLLGRLEGDPPKGLEPPFSKMIPR